VCIVQKIDVDLGNASAAYLICSDVDYLVSKLKRYSGFHGSGSCTDVSYGIRWNFSYVVCDILAYMSYKYLLLFYAVGFSEQVCTEAQY